MFSAPFRTKFFTRTVLALLLAFSLLILGCTSSKQDGASADSTSATVTGKKTSSATFFTRLLKLLAGPIGDPNNSTELPPDSQGRVCTTDNYQQQAQPTFHKVDVLFVQDTMGTCRSTGHIEQDTLRVATHIGNMLRQIPNSVDMRVSVLLSQVSRDYSGKLFGSKHKPIVLSNQNLSGEQLSSYVFQALIEGQHKTDPALGEAAFYSLNKAITSELNNNQKLGFFRPDAALAVVFISDKQELGALYPASTPGIPPRCDAYWEDRFKREYYDNNNLTMDVLASRLLKLKGEIPITMHAFLNTGIEDLAKENDLGGRCISDNIGYGYMDIVQRFRGKTFSIQSTSAPDDMELIGQNVGDSLQLIHDFRLSKPSEHVDPATIQAFVDDISKRYSYDPKSDVVHLDDAGTFSSKIRIQHCDYYQFDWQIADLAGTPTFSAVTLEWKTPGQDTNAIVRVGMSPTDLSFRSYTIADFSASHTLLVDRLLPETTYYFQVTARDKFTGQRVSATIPVTTLKAPIAWTINGPSGTTTANSATIDWSTPGMATKAMLYVGKSATDLSLQVIPVEDFSINQERIVKDLEPSTFYYFKVIAEDKQGSKVESGVISLRTKDLPPDWSVAGFDATMAIDGGVAIWQTQNVPTTAKLKIGLSADNLNAFIIDVPVPATSQQISFSGLMPDTLYFLQAVATDKDGVTHASQIISKRTKPDPITWSIAGFAGIPTFDSVNISWNTGAEPTTAVLKVGLSASDLSFKTFNLATAQTSQAQVVNGLAELTSYYFQVVATDLKGRSLTSDVISVSTLLGPTTWNINNLAAATTFNSATVSWDTGTKSTKAILRVGLSANDLSLQTIQIPEFAATHSQVVTGLDEITTYFFQVVATDQQGRSLPGPVFSAKTLLGPITWSINNLAAATTFNSATVSWDTGTKLTNAVLRVGISESDLSLRTIQIPGFAASHSQAVTGLDEITTYFFQIVAVDQQGRSVTSPVISAKTALGPITWSINNLRATTTFNSATVSWDTGMKLTNAVLKVGLSANDLTLQTIEIADFTAAHEQMVSGLEEITTYFFQIVAMDEQGRKVTSSVFTAKTTLGPITWSINNLAATTTFNTATIAWDTGSKLTNAVLRVGASPTDLSLQTISIGDFAASHLQIVKSLEELTTYYFQITATDQQGRSLTSEVISATTALGPATWMVNNLAGTPSFTDITMSWNTGGTATTALLKVGLSANDLSLQQIKIDAAATSQSVNVKGLLPQTTYFFQVVASDSHNRPVSSPIVSLTTLAQTWTIGGLDATTTSNSMTVIWQTQAALTNGLVMIGLSANDLTFAQIEVPNFNTSQLVTVRNLNPNTRYFVQVRATDQQGRNLLSNVISKVTKPTAGKTPRASRVIGMQGLD